MSRRRLAGMFTASVVALAIAAGVPGVATAASVTVLSSDFESAFAPWGARGSGVTLELTSADAHSGASSLEVSGRTANWQGAATDALSLFAPGKLHKLSVWVKLAPGAEAQNMAMTVERKVGGEASYDQVVSTSVTADAWTELAGTYTLPSGMDEATLYIEAAGAETVFLVDDVLITTSSTSVQTGIPSLRDVLPFHVGAAIDARETVDQPAQLLTKHFDQITAENQMKPESIQPTEGTFTFDAADQLVEYAIANGLRVYGHTLVWHAQTPDWFFKNGDRDLTNSAADQAILLGRMRTHITTIAQHFRDKYGDTNPIWAFDVVNEAIDASQSDGLRRSRWYDVLGPDYIKDAFTIARGAFGSSVKLFLNDYNTELPEKREAMYDVVAGLIADGVPIDGVGSQFHLSLAQAVSQLDATLTRFAGLGLLQAVTELDVTTYLSGGESWTNPPEERLIQQGYYYRDVFNVLRAHAEQLGSVTLWGLYDSRSWLRSGSAPLVFDNDLQAKYAYWGIVDPTRLPTLTRTANAHAGDVPIDADAAAAREWKLLPVTTITSTDAGTTGFQVRWAADHLTAYLKVADPTDDGAADTVELFTGDGSLSVARDGGVTGNGTAVVTSTADGFVVVAALPLTTTVAQGASVPFDTRVTDGSGDVVSWNDPDNEQEDGQRLGRLTLIEPVSSAAIPQALVAPEIDGVVDAQWSGAPVVTTGVQVEGQPGATADIRLLWSDGLLNVLAEVTDPSLDESNSNAWEQDSVEVFVDPGNDKAGAFGPEDGQYRVSFTNHQSISGEAEVQDNVTSAAAVTGAGYLVEASIAMDSTAIGDLVGLEFQVNDATDGARTSVRTWADPTGRSYQNTTRWGVGELAKTNVVANPKVLLGKRTVRAGGSLPVQTTGFMPGSQVELRLAAICRPHATCPSTLLATVTADAMGTASATVTVPTRTRPGVYAVVASSDGLRAAARVLVLPPPPPPPPWWLHRP